MKKVLIIGYGDLGQRISSQLQDHHITAISRSNRVIRKYSQWFEWDWTSGHKLSLSEVSFATIVLILKPTSTDFTGYQVGYLEAAHTILENINSSLEYQQLVVISSTRVYGQNDGRNITEKTPATPDDYRGEIILEYEQLISKQSKVPPLFLRSSGLYSINQNWMNKFVNNFEGKKFQLASKEANRFDRNVLSKVVSRYIDNLELCHLNGLFICSEPSKKYSQIFEDLFPGKSFEDFFITPDYLGKTFDWKKLIESGLMG